MVEQIMNKKHKEWKNFCELLNGKEGCNFQEKIKGKPDSITWKCKGETKGYAENILKKYFPKINIKKTFKYFEKNGGYCDCEILFNVNEDDY